LSPKETPLRKKLGNVPQKSAVVSLFDTKRHYIEFSLPLLAICGVAVDRNSGVVEVQSKRAVVDQGP
jgi:hypothetical protein